MELDAWDQGLGEDFLLHTFCTLSHLNIIIVFSKINAYIKVQKEKKRLTSYPQENPGVNQPLKCTWLQQNLGGSPSRVLLPLLAGEPVLPGLIHTLACIPDSPGV